MIHMINPYADTEPTRSEVDTWSGPAVLEFGQNWCGYCQGAQPVIAEAFADHPQVKHVKVGDGKGQPLGRSFRVKLWPNLVFLKDGVVIRHWRRIHGKDGASAYRLDWNGLSFVWTGMAGRIRTP